MSRYTDYRKESKMLGIDVSHWQGNIDFEAVKKAGYSFVIIKCGGSDRGFYKDSKFETYYRQAKEAGLYVGAYYFVGRKFRGTESGVADAKRMIELIRGKSFEMPVVVDVENQQNPSVNRGKITDATIAFCKTLEENGYYAMIYGQDYQTFVESLDIERLGAYDKWVARYSTSKPKYVESYGIWQYGGDVNYLCRAKVSGVSSNACDQNFAYKDYPTIMRKNKLNGC